MNMNTNTRKLFKMLEDFVENRVYDMMSQPQNPEPDFIPTFAANQVKYLFNSRAGQR